MGLSQLQIFSKKRDATATLKGFEFQHLKTLETWLSNRVTRINEVIYCDYEEDIFQRSLTAEKTKFRQIKLYSTNFSFASEEIQQTIVNFFLLFCKGEYMFDEITFSFETNASIVGKVVKGNDADLLEAWAKEQGQVIGSTLDRVRARVIGIIDISLKHDQEGRTNSDNKSEFQKARNVFNNLSHEILDNFINSIRWQFDGIGVDSAIENQITAIKALIDKLPITVSENTDTVLSILYRQVTTHAIQNDPEDRKLTNQLLDVTLLNAGDDKQKWYTEIFDKWLSEKTVTDFHAGEFYEILLAGQYYRQNFHEADHKELWMSLLSFYINDKNTNPVHRRKATYEFLFMALNPDPRNGKPIGSLKGYEQYIRYYFDNWSHRLLLTDISNDIHLLQIILPFAIKKQIDISFDEIDKWLKEISNFLDQGIIDANDPDERCTFLQLKGSFILDTNLEKSKEVVEEALEFYRQILPILAQTKLYSIGPLFGILQSIIDLFISFNLDQSAINSLEAFLEEAEKAANEAGQRHVSAKKMVSRAVGYMEAGGIQNMLQAINCLHKAKDLWLLEPTKEGYVLALLNLSQFYYAIGMNIAGKYYALSSIWAIWHFNDETYFSRLAQATALLFAGDFKQGAWFAAFEDFELFIQSKNEFTPSWLTNPPDKLFNITMAEISFLIFAATELSPEVKIFFDYRTKIWGELWQELGEPIVADLKSKLNTPEEITKSITHILTAEPLSDAGKLRSISFNALNIDWKIFFENTHALTGISEEFSSILQIFLCEVARTAPTLLTAGATVNIEIIATSGEITTVQTAKSDWTISIPVFLEKDPQKLKKHYAMISLAIKNIFTSLRTIPQTDFENVWWKELHEIEKVHLKIYSINTYQKAYHNSVDQKAFNDSGRTHFNPLPLKTVFKTLPKLLI